MLRTWSFAALLLAAANIAACSSDPLRDPIGAGDAIARCMDKASKGEKAGGFAPIPFLACR